MNMTVQDRVQRHYEAACEKFGADNIFVTALYGSQNYGLATELSDVDTKTMILPTLHDIVKGKQMTSTDIDVDGEINTVKDVRGMFQNFMKQNINFTEVLFSEYTIVNPLYRGWWLKLVTNRELIAACNPKKMLHAAAGMAQQKYHAFAKPFEGKIAVLEKYGYDPKQLHHLLRLGKFMRDYLNGQSFAECLIADEDERAYLMQIKNEPPILEDARQLLELGMSRVDALLEQTNERYAHEPFMNGYAQDLLDSIAYDIVTYHLTRQLRKEETQWIVEDEDNDN